MTINETATTSSNLASQPASIIAMSAVELDGYLTGIAVTPRATPIGPGRGRAYLWGDDGPTTFDSDAQIKRVLGSVINHYNVMVAEIDRSLTLGSGQNCRLSAAVPVRRAKTGAR